MKHIVSLSIFFILAIVAWWSITESAKVLFWFLSTPKRFYPSSPRVAYSLSVWLLL